MIIKQYSDYLLESKTIELLLESKIIYSKDFINILNKMKSNKLANVLLDLYYKDIDGIAQNYISTTDQKDVVSFTPDRRIQDLIKDTPQTWEVTESNKHLTHSSVNDKIFERLGYDKTDRVVWSPPAGTIGIILSETISKASGKAYALFQELTNNETPRQCVINKISLVLPSNDQDNRIWNLSRNNIKVGRFARALLTKADIDFSDKDIEEFTNIYKATYDFSKDKLKQFDIVKGSDIAHWYDGDLYVYGGGGLNNSCMASVNSDYFDIYVYNENVSMVILYSDDGTIEDGKYRSNKIKGRAILWDAELDGSEIKFLDRIYTTHDSDIELFQQFADSNRFIHREPARKMIVKLERWEFDYYPYMDTMCYLSESDSTLTNMYSDDLDREFRSTGGDWDSI